MGHYSAKSIAYILWSTQCRILFSTFQNVKVVLIDFYPHDRKVKKTLRSSVMTQAVAEQRGPLADIIYNCINLKSSVTYT